MDNNSNTASNSTYFQRIWRKIKRVISEPEQNNNNFMISNVADNLSFSVPNKKARLDVMLNESFDQAAFMEVMKKLLTCSVCLEVRKQANQCQNGHLICINCTLCIQQSSASNKDINCPVCRVPLTHFYQRSLLAEQLVSELPTKCRFCLTIMSGRHIQQHEKESCMLRTIECQYSLFGCVWKGQAKDKLSHESLCAIGNSSVSRVSQLVNDNMRDQLRYYDKRNSHWINILGKLREKNCGLKLFLKHVVLTKYKQTPKISFKTMKLQIINGNFSVKFKILKDSKTSNLQMQYKLIYTGKDKITLNFFLNSFRFDDDIYELDDNMHYYNFTEEDSVAGAFTVNLAKHCIRDDDFYNILMDKDSLYFEIILSFDNNENVETTNILTNPIESGESLAQVLNNSRGNLQTSNAGNLVVALISSNSLPNQNNEEETDEPYEAEDNNDEDDDDEEEEEDADNENEANADDDNEENDAVDEEEEEEAEQDNEEENNDAKDEIEITTEETDNLEADESLNNE